MTNLADTCPWCGYNRPRTPTPPPPRPDPCPWCGLDHNQLNHPGDPA